MAEPDLKIKDFKSATELEVDSFEDLDSNYPLVAILESYPSHEINYDHVEPIVTKISENVDNESEKSSSLNLLDENNFSFPNNIVDSEFELEKKLECMEVLSKESILSKIETDKSSNEHVGSHRIFSVNDKLQMVLDHSSLNGVHLQKEAINNELLTDSASECTVVYCNYNSNDNDQIENNFNVNIYYDVPLEEVSNEFSMLNIPTASQNSIEQDLSKEAIDLINCNDINELESEDSLLSELESELEINNSDISHLTGLPNGLNSKLDVHNHPEFKTLFADYTNMKIQMDQQSKELQRILAESNKYKEELDEVSKQYYLYKQKLSNNTADNIERIYEAQIEELEKTIDCQEKELQIVKDRLLSHDAIAKQAVATLQKNLSSKIEQLTKSYENCLKERDRSVMKFAGSEKTIIDLRKEKEQVENKVREHQKEKEILINKLKNMKAEIIRLNGNLESKTNDYCTLQQEFDKIKEELSSKDIKIKWAQNKLKSEMETHKETKTKLEKTLQKLKEKQEEAEQIRRDCQQIVKTYQDSEEIKSNSLDIQLKEKLTELEMQKQEKYDQEEVYQLMIKELDALKKKHKDCLEEIASLKVKINSFDAERSENDKVISKYKDTLNNQKKEILGLQNQIDEFKKFKEELMCEQNKLQDMHSELENIRLTNMDLVHEASDCRKREAELLEFTERITIKNVQLQSEFTALESKVMLLEDENHKLDKRCTHLEKHNNELSLKLEDEKTLWQQETDELSRKLEDKIKSVENLTIKLEEECNDNKILRRKHATALKDLTRQLQQAKKRLEALEAGQSVDKESLSLGSRTSSNGSLETVGNTQVIHSSNTMHNNSYAIIPPSEPVDTSSSVIVVDKSILLERIVTLQKANARKSEKIEFLEEHVSQLVEELQKKTKIIQKIMISKEPGTLAPEVKAQLAKRGGIMASVYSSHPSDDALTLDLSLEINRKLQTVLEDTLLKNFTLKENLETLGEEIAKLSQENRRLQLEKQNKISVIENTK